MIACYLRRGDITKCKSECIVNAANESGLGCFTPNHPCIDNAIHKAAGPGLLAECRTLGGVPTGTASITGGYNLPAKYIIHATGPKKHSTGYEDHAMLARTYVSILELATSHKISELVFCSISSGMYGFDQQRAANTHYNTVKSWLDRNPNTSLKKVIFNVFTQEDETIYRQLLGVKD